MDLPPRQRLGLTSVLLESAEAASDSGAEVAWDSAIRDGVRVIDEDRVIGIAYAEVMQEAERRLAVTI